MVTGGEDDDDDEAEREILHPGVQSQGGAFQADAPWDSEVRLRTYSLACGAAGGMIGLVTGIWLGSSSCEETAWWNPLAALRAMRAAGQNPFLRAFAPQSVEGLHLASAGIISAAVGGAGVLGRIGVGIISSEEKWSLRMWKRAPQGELDSSNEREKRASEEKEMRKREKGYQRELMMRDLLDLRGELGESRHEQTRGDILGTRVEEVKERDEAKPGRRTGGSSAGLPLQHRPLAPPPGRCGRAAAGDGPLSISFHPGQEEDVYSVYNQGGGAYSTRQSRSELVFYPLYY